MNLIDDTDVNYNKKKNIKKINFLSNSKRVNTTKLFK